MGAQLPQIPGVHPCVVHAFANLFDQRIPFKSVRLDCEQAVLRDRVNLQIMVLAPTSTQAATDSSSRRGHWITLNDNYEISIFSNTLEEIAVRLNRVFQAQPRGIELYVSFRALAGQDIPRAWLEPNLDKPSEIQKLARMSTELNLVRDSINNLNLVLQNLLAKVRPVVQTAAVEGGVSVVGPASLKPTAKNPVADKRAAIPTALKPTDVEGAASLEPASKKPAAAIDLPSKEPLAEKNAPAPVNAVPSTEGNPSEIQVIQAAEVIVTLGKPVAKYGTYGTL